MDDPDDEKNYDFFVSYAQADESWVENFLIHSLRMEECSVATVKSHYSPAIPKPVVFENLIKDSKKILLICSPDYFSNPDGNEYARYIEPLAQHQDVENKRWTTIPVLFRDTELPLRFDMFPGIDFREEEKWEQSMKQLLGSLTHQQEKYIPPSSPYRGLDVFEEPNKNIFFGRKELTQQLCIQLEATRFLAILGSSGSGKSSLVNAGLIPAFKDINKIQWKGCSSLRITPGHDPLGCLSLTFRGNVLDQPQASVITFLKKQNKQYLVLFIDQFEELFTLSHGNEEAFCQWILTLQRLERVYIVLAVRSDFYEALTFTPLWGVIENNLHTLRPLVREQLAEVIRLPAESVRVGVDPLLVQRIVHDAGRDPGILPFVQVTMSLLWERLQHPYLSLSSYEKLRPPDSHDPDITGLKAAIAIRAKVAMDGFDEAEKLVLRCIFLRLIHFGENEAPHTRSPKEIEEILSCGNSSNKVINILSSKKIRLLSIYKTSDNKRLINIVHDSVIDGWPTLKTWVNKYCGMEKQRRRLFYKYNEWARMGKGKSGLLSGVEIDEVDSFLNNVGDTFNLNKHKDLKKFIKVSKKANNPGWNYKGLMVSMTLFAWFSFNIYILYLLIDKSVERYQWGMFNEYLSYISYVVLFLIISYVIHNNATAQKITKSAKNISLGKIFLSLLLVGVPFIFDQFQRFYNPSLDICEDYVREPGSFSNLFGIEVSKLEDKEKNIFLISRNKYIELGGSYANLNIDLNQASQCKKYFKSIVSLNVVQNDEFWNAELFPIHQKNNKPVIQIRDVPLRAFGKTSCEALYNLSIELESYRKNEIWPIDAIKSNIGTDCGNLLLMNDAIYSLHQGNLNAAFVKFKQIFQSDKENIINLAYYIFSAIALGKSVEIGEIEKISHGNDYINYLIGEYLLNDGNYYGSIEYYNKSIDMKYPWPYVRLAAIYKRLGDNKNFDKYLEKAKGKFDALVVLDGDINDDYMQDIIVREQLSIKILEEKNMENKCFHYEQYKKLINYLPPGKSPQFVSKKFTPSCLNMNS